MTGIARIYAGLHQLIVGITSKRRRIKQNWELKRSLNERSLLLNTRISKPIRLALQHIFEFHRLPTNQNAN